MDEVRRLGALEGAEINRAKEILAFEITKIIHECSYKARTLYISPEHSLILIFR